MKTIEKFRNYSLMAIILFAALTITSCSDDDDVPEEEDDLEVITDVTLIFTNVADATDVVMASAEDPDGLGVDELEVLDDITLAADTQYTLTFEVLNALDPTDVEDIGEEILGEDDEHQIFFSFTADAFDSPGGNGNIDTASDPINYNDQDENGNPVGLSTSWTTPAAGTTTGGTFTVRLQHQPDIKTADTGADDGDSDFDLDFVLNIQ